jgi:hypothetical protein
MGRKPNGKEKAMVMSSPYTPKAVKGQLSAEAIHRASLRHKDSAGLHRFITEDCVK